MRSLAVTALVFTGCQTSFSPPVRSVHAGMPGGLQASRTEVNLAALGWGTANAVSPPAILGLHVGRGLSSTVAIEGGISGLGSLWLMGWGGLRVTARATSRVVGDAELGFGAGAGGVSYGSGKRWYDLPAWGGYFGAGLGVQPLRWLGVYGRARAEASWGGQTPYTLWLTALLGVELSPWESVAFGVSGGFGTFGPNAEGWIYQAHFTIRP